MPFRSEILWLSVFPFFLLAESLFPLPLRNLWKSLEEPKFLVQYEKDHPKYKQVQEQLGNLSECRWKKIGYYMNAECYDKVNEIFKLQGKRNFTMIHSRINYAFNAMLKKMIDCAFYTVFIDVYVQHHQFFIVFPSEILRASNKVKSIRYTQ